MSVDNNVAPVEKKEKPRQKREVLKIPVYSKITAETAAGEDIMGCKEIKKPLKISQSR